MRAQNSLQAISDTSEAIAVAFGGFRNYDGLLAMLEEAYDDPERARREVTEFIVAQQAASRGGNGK